MEEILHEGRFAGLILHPSSLPNVSGLAGDFGKSAYAFVDYLQANRMNYWQVLPLGPCKYNGEQPGCPYLSTSSFALNPLFVSVEALIADSLVSEEEVKQLLEDIEKDEPIQHGGGTDQKLVQGTDEESRCAVDQCTVNAAAPGCVSDASGGHTWKCESVREQLLEQGDDDTTKSYCTEKKLEPIASGMVNGEDVTSRAHVGRTPVASPLVKAGESPPANFAKTVKFKEKVLTLCYERFTRKDTPQEFRNFCKKNRFWLEGYAYFEALQARFPNATTWLQWPDQYKDYRACCKKDASSLLTMLATPLGEEEIARRTDSNVAEPQSDALTGEKGKGNEQQMKTGHSSAENKAEKNVVYQTTPEYHKFVQYTVFTHWKALKNYANEHEVNIFGDVAFYVNLHSSDVWTSPEMFQMDSATLQPLFVSGSPPDFFCEGGQLWGHPVYDWPAHERTRFRWWTQRIKTIFEHVDALRLDHFRGFVAYWRVPYEHAVTHKDASKGEWVSGPGDRLFDALYKNMGWLLPQKTIPAAMNLQTTPKKTRAKNSSIKHKLRHMACWAMIANGFSGGSHVDVNPTPIAQPAVTGEGNAVVQQKSPEVHCDVIASDEPRLTYRGTAPMIVAEDLGLITEDIVILRDKYNILSMRVLQFAWAEQEKGPNCEHLPYNITRNCCVYTGTHDNDTLVGWWESANEAQKRHLTNFLGVTKEPSADEARLHLIRLALGTVAHLVIIPAQDLIGLGNEGRFNTPGVDSPQNWSWQLESLVQLAASVITEPLGKILEASGRVKSINDSFPV